MNPVNQWAKGPGVQQHEQSLLFGALPLSDCVLLKPSGFGIGKSERRTFIPVQRKGVGKGVSSFT